MHTTILFYSHAFRIIKRCVHKIKTLLTTKYVMGNC